MPDACAKTLKPCTACSPAEAFSTALAPSLGRSEAHALVEAASREAVAQGRALPDILSADARVTAILAPARISEMADPVNGLGSAVAFVTSALALWADSRA